VGDWLWLLLDSSEMRPRCEPLIELVYDFPPLVAQLNQIQSRHNLATLLPGCAGGVVARVRLVLGCAASWMDGGASRGWTQGKGLMAIRQPG